MDPMFSKWSLNSSAWHPKPLNWGPVCHSKPPNLLLLLFSRWVFSNSLWPHELQHTRLHCPSLSPWVCSNSFHWVSDAIQPPHPLSPPSPLALNPSQHQGLFQWTGSSHQVAKVLKLQFQHQSFQRIFNIPCCPPPIIVIMQVYIVLEFTSTQMPKCIKTA